MLEKLVRGLRRMLRWFMRKGLATQYVIILTGVALVFSVSLLITNQVAREAVRGDSAEQYSRNITQVQDRIESYCDDLENTAMGIVNNPVLLAYMRTEYAYERIWRQNDLEKLTANTRQMKPEIVMVSLYDREQNLIGNNGTIFFRQTPETGVSVLRYTAPVTAQDKQTYFTLQTPIYDAQNGSTNFLGTAVFLVRASEIRGFLENAFPAEGCDVFLIGTEDAVFLKTGNTFQVPPEKSVHPAGYLVEHRSCAGAGWELLIITSESSLFGGINLLQKINYITYVMVFVIMLLMAFLLYRGFINPIRRQVCFMRRHGKNPTERLTVYSENEIGMISGSLNSMLDDIDTLSRQNYQAQRKYYELELVKRKTELLAYRNQINPHFLRNTFECIRGMALHKDAQDIADITESLSKMFSYSIMGDAQATVAQELDNVREYARIINYRFRGRHQVQICADPALLEKRIPKMLIQPLVENAIFHGVETIVAKGIVRVEISAAANDEMRISISDNGRGISEEALQTLRERLQCVRKGVAQKEETAGIGILNIYHRLILYYGEKLSFQLDSKIHQGTCVCMCFPADYREDLQENKYSQREQG